MVEDSYWYKPFTARYRYVRVSRATGYELGTLNMLKGGSITRNSDTSIKETATATVVGSFDIGADLVRIYLYAEWEDGTTQDVVLGTFLPSTPKRNVYGSYSEAEVKMYGRLQELYVDSVGAPTTMAAGESALEAAIQVCTDSGLEVVADDSEYVLSSSRTYGISTDDETKLAEINDLLDLASFSSASTDTMGRVLMNKYVAPAKRTSSWTFEEGANARFLRDMTDEQDETDIPNHVVCVYSTEDATIVGEAWDTSEDSKYSTVNQGRTVTTGYAYTELPTGDDEDEMTETADAKAASLLTEAQSVIHRVTMSHTYCPITIGDAITLKYPSGDIAGTFIVRTQKITLGAGCLIEAEVKEVA